MNQKSIEILVPVGAALILAGYFLPWGRDSSGFTYARWMLYLWIPFVGALVFIGSYFLLHRRARRSEWFSVAKITAAATAISVAYRVWAVAQLGGLKSLRLGMFLVIVGTVLSVAGTIASLQMDGNAKERRDQLDPGS